MSMKSPPIQPPLFTPVILGRPVSPLREAGPPISKIATASNKVALRKEAPKRRFRRLDAWLLAKLREMPDESMSFCSSFVVHVLLLLLLALLTRSLASPSRHLILLPSDGAIAGESAFTLQEVAGESESTEALIATDGPNLSLERVTPELTTASEIPIARSFASDIEKARNAVSTSVALPTSPGGASSLFMNSSLDGRDLDKRRGLALSNGGSVESEQAVDDALEWFARHQLADGSWSTELTADPCKGRCQHGTIELGRPKKIAATGLALLCYLGAGHTHKKGMYQENVLGGLVYLTNCVKDRNRRNAQSTGRLVEEGAAYEMYEQGIASLALCEAYQMTGDSMLRGPLEICIEYIQRCQHSNGSWGYHPNESGDLSIVGWQIMALKSASKIGLKVRPDVIRRADSFLDSQQSGNGAYYGYRGPEKEACTTAIGLLLRLYRGWTRTDPRIMEGSKYIMDLGPSLDGIYYNYYATQLLFHLKLDRWAEWNTISRDYLVREQSKDGHEKGSWYFGRNTFNKVGGRLYNTAMATLTLEVYYRNMPIYAELSGDSFSL
jgi:hypothetical protein